MAEITKKTIICRGQTVDLTVPRVMGIINSTPDSFYAGSRLEVGLEVATAAVATAARMLDEGATFLDVGGYSTRPGATTISPTEEADRVLPVIEAILNSFPDALISVDTFRADVARQAVEQGAAMINDVSGGTLDADMFATVAGLGVPYVLMHLRGTPQTMQSLTHYTDLVPDVVAELTDQLTKLRSYGPVQVIIDPGFGFAKTADQNFLLLRELAAFAVFDAPILVGLSRKATIYKTLNTSAEFALNGTTVVNTVALLGGASILRVHDVREAVDAVILTQRLKKV
ncbi:dihydropteroate synthase [Fibrella sp. HMF5335]|uniref:dihydropteroate synthase n=1 Tax=Fibrella rubiginis TaxID=2817060 RepID=A0A939K2A6_9BACT|nr:dihydropteroate synthase [Fibrella rubiginis]MBO0936114.1 dihydropteroate synthase [Fibrella rubiginis]